jgi:hypothetical protein
MVVRLARSVPPPSALVKSWTIFKPLAAKPAAIPAPITINLVTGFIRSSLVRRLDYAYHAPPGAAVSRPGPML